MRSWLRSADRRLFLVGLPACGIVMVAAALAASAEEAPPHSPELDRMIQDQAKKNNVPESLVRRIVMRESKYDPAARNHKYWGLMQISYPTAKSMGFKGTPSELLNPLVNLTYAVPYLANAFVIAGRREDEAVRLYASGYYFTARQRGLLGVLHGADPDALPQGTQVASAEPAQVGVYGSLPASPQMAAMTPPPAPPPSAMDLAAMKGATDLVADRDGTIHPPKKWRHDGGVTEIARGDQGLGNVVAYSAPKDASKDTSARKTAHHSRKTTEFASIDMPSSAQAYAGEAPQDPRFAQAASQAAIAQATAPQEQRPTTFFAQGTVGEPQGAASATPDPSQQVAAVDPAAAAAPKPDDKASKHRHATHRPSPKANATEVASSDGSTGGDVKTSRHHAARHVAKTQAVVAAADHAEASSKDASAKDAPALRP